MPLNRYSAENAAESNHLKMCMWLLASVLGAVAVIPIHFLSVEHLKLQRKNGKERGTKIGEILGLVSGWGFFLFWFGIWFSSQPRFAVPILENLSVQIVSFSIPILHLIIFSPLFLAGVWLGIEGVRETTLKVAETHRTERVVTKGAYSIVRHPQYLGGLLSHVSFSFLLSGWYSMLSFPLVAVLVYLISKKEEEELVREFGKQYEDYKKEVPMLVPKLKKSE
jgi:protein-S-isoprenylcysteine O-methyltransferase Ste14